MRDRAERKAVVKRAASDSRAILKLDPDSRPSYNCVKPKAAARNATETSRQDAATFPIREDDPRRNSIHTQGWAVFCDLSAPILVQLAIRKSNPSTNSSGRDDAREGEAPAEPRTRGWREVGHDFAWRRLGGSLALPP